MSVPFRPPANDERVHGAGHQARHPAEELRGFGDRQCGISVIRSSVPALEWCSHPWAARPRPVRCPTPPGAPEAEGIVALSVDTCVNSGTQLGTRRDEGADRVVWLRRELVADRQLVTPSCGAPARRNDDRVPSEGRSAGSSSSVASRKPSRVGDGAEASALPRRSREATDSELQAVACRVSGAHVIGGRRERRRSHS